jgi:hypothetical protein
MRRIIFWTGTLVLGLAAAIWATAPLLAQRGGERGRGEPVRGGGHPIARTGSIHFGGRVGRDPVGPAIRPVEGREGVHRNPYHEEYARHFRPGYRPIMLGGAQYYMYDNLPVGCQTVLQNGITYDVCDGVYYQPYIYGGQTVYLVVPT